MLNALIFDLDGTLIDSNGAHVQAWKLAFEQFGYKVADDLIFNHVGKGGDHFVPAVLGKEADDKDGDALRKAQPEEFAKIAKSQGLRAFPEGAELIQALRGRGLKIALATSGSKKALDLNEECSGLKISKLVDVLVNADDIKSSKPSPDLVSAAVSKLKLSPAQCAMVGDTPFDAESAKRAGVVTLGVTCGGHSPETLRSAGARAVYNDPQDILAHLDEALQIASPGTAHLTQKLLEQLMREALETAEDAIAAGEAPIGAIFARGDGTVIARGFNAMNSTQNPTSHAEMVTFAKAAGKVPADAKDLILACNLEPCVMCLGAAMVSAVDTIVYALEAPADSGTRRVTPPQSPESGMPRIVGQILHAESRKLFEKWLKKGDTSNPKQVQFVKQLLSLTE